jgi:1-acyl-sn-glycerol-3-phosphate acyltransferase
VEYHGKDNIPKDGTVIYAPNHTNTLMDALAILIIDKQAKVFVARADVFKHPTLLKILTFLKMLPINRRRDGIESLAKNEEITAVVVDVLHDKIPFCILPEGTHRAKHGLLPLQKGIFRIALQANASFGEEIPVYIVPVGIEYGHFFRYRSSLLLQIGSPINITQFVKDHPDWDTPEQINYLRDDLSDQLKKLLLNVSDESNYDAMIELCLLCGDKQQRIPNLRKNKLLDRFTTAKQTLQEADSLLKSNPQDMQNLLQSTGDFARKRHALHIGLPSVLNTHLRSSLALKTILLLLGLPCFVGAFIANLPITGLSVWMCSKFKDRAFHNTLRYLISFLLFPVLMLVAGLTVGLTCSWIVGIIAAFLVFFSFFFLHEYLRLLRRFMSDLKWLVNRGLRKQFGIIRQEWKNISQKSDKTETAS